MDFVSSCYRSPSPWHHHLTDIQIPGQLEKELFFIENYFKQNLNPEWDLKFTSELMEMRVRPKTRSNWSNSLKLSLIFFSLLIKKGITFSCQWEAFGLGILYNSRNHFNKLVRKHTVQAILFFGLWGDYRLNELGGGVRQEFTWWILGNYILCTFRIHHNLLHWSHSCKPTSGILDLENTFITILE